MKNFTKLASGISLVAILAIGSFSTDATAAVNPNDVLIDNVNTEMMNTILKTKTFIVKDEWVYSFED